MPKPHFVHALQAGQPQTLVVFGTSLSQGLAPILRDGLHGAWGEGIRVVNAGLPGRASRTGLAELEKRVLDHAPDAVLLEFAVNDAHSYWHEPEALDAGISLAESQENLRTLAERVLQTFPGCEIIVHITNPAWDPAGNDRHPGTSRPHLEAYYEGYRQVARQLGLALLDNHRFWEDLRLRSPLWFEELIPDGVHPTPAALREVLVPHIMQQWH